jgi:hypothetical protein
MKTQLLLCFVLVSYCGLLGCSLVRSPQVTAIARVKPFVTGLEAYHRKTGDYPQTLDDLYPRYVPANVSWYNNEDHRHIWVIGYEKVSPDDYKLFLDSSPCSQAIFENGRFVWGGGPNYQKNGTYAAGSGPNYQNYQ